MAIVAPKRENVPGVGVAPGAEASGCDGREEMVTLYHEVHVADVALPEGVLTECVHLDEVLPHLAQPLFKVVILRTILTALTEAHQFILSPVWLIFSQCLILIG